MGFFWLVGCGPLGMFSKFWRLFAVTSILVFVLIWNQDLSQQYHNHNVSFFRKNATTFIDEKTPYPIASKNVIINQKEEFEIDDTEEVATSEYIHIAIVCMGYSGSRNVVTLIKSIIFYRRHPIIIHLITDSIANTILKQLTDSWSIPQTQFHFYDTTSMLPQLSWVPVRQGDSLLKLILIQILPVDLDNVIVLDADVTVVTDIAKLWKLFKYLTGSQVLGLVENQSNGYLRRDINNAKREIMNNTWPEYNTRIMIMDLNGLRSINWIKIWGEVAKETLRKSKRSLLSYEDIINAVLVRQPSLLYKLPCNWNIQFCGSCHYESLCYRNSAEFDKNLYFTFVQYDGNLLRQQNHTLNATESNKTDQCFEFRKILYRTHIYYLNYSQPEHDDNGITFVAQLSLDRLHTLEPLCRQWSGPISIALYLSDSEVLQFFDFVLNSEVMKRRNNIGYHIVYKEGSSYPINYLRNVALNNVNTPFVFLSDIDFFPSHNIYQYLQKSCQNLFLESNSKSVLVVPAFETLKYNRETIPENKEILIKLLDTGDISPFKFNQGWKLGHAQTNFSRWKTATKPYNINWKLYFEPYIVARNNVTRYDERFTGYGWDKTAQIMEIAYSGFTFIVLPDVFLVHFPHPKSIDDQRFRSSYRYRRCLQSRKTSFDKYLRSEYGSPPV